MNLSRIWWKDYCCQCFFSKEPISSISQTFRKQKTFYVGKKGFQQNGPFGRKCKKDLSKLFTKIAKARPSKLLVPDFWLWATQWRAESEFKFILHIWSLLVSKSLELSFIKMGLVGEQVSWKAFGKPHLLNIFLFTQISFMSRLNILKENFLELPVLLYYNYTAKMMKILSFCTKKRVYLRWAESVYGYQCCKYRIERACKYTSYI